MRITTTLVITGLLCALALASPAPANAQGCTLGLPSSIENALNTLLLGACGRHDTCWRTRNPCGGPYLGFGWKATCDLQFLIELEGICQIATGIFSFPNPDYSSVQEFMDDCQDGAELAYTAVSTIGIPFWFSTQCTNGCNAAACPNAVPPRQLPEHCCPVLPRRDCFVDADCLPGWECIAGQCSPMDSPLVLYLPDYLPIEGHGQSWWREGFCGPKAPTVCLDWRDEGSLTCTEWTIPESEVAFVVTLNDVDMMFLAAGQSVRAEPWRQFFGNVTKGPAGDFPFAHGFEALAAHCGHDPYGTDEIDLTECGELLYAWADRSGDGRLDLDELVAFPDLGISSLGVVRSTDKQDKCGNAFPVESHALCTDRPGKCGTWLDVFLGSRPPVP